MIRHAAYFGTLSLLLSLPGCSGDDPGASDSATTSGSATDSATSGATETTGGTDSGSDSDSGAGFDDEEEFVLRLNDSPVPPLSLEMDREQVTELFGDTAKDILLVEVDSTPLLVNSLNEIKAACGDAWKIDDPDPKHDCGLTPLGQTFKGADNTWKTSAEYSLVRILTMTPANSKVAGTSIAGMQEMADFLNIGGGFSQILSESLGLPRTEEFIDTENMAKAIQDDLLATHPAIGGDGKTLPVTLYDALTDLGSLAEKFGPMGDHPGLLDPNYETKSVVLSDEFAMTVSAESNMKLLDGVDLSVGKGYMSTIVDNIGPTYEDELEFDFEDPDKFQISGVVENPTVDMRFAVYEHNGFVDSCAGDDACQANLPENIDQVKQQWPGSAWALDPWLLEHLVVRGARYRFGDRIWDKCYLLCAAHIHIGPDADYPNNPSGWSVYDVLFDLGNPPKDQYLWELINEVAQVALHTPPYGDIPEGQGDVAFTLSDIPIGVSGSAISEAARPYLQEQAAKLSDLILGDYWKNNDAVDFYYRRGANNVPYVFFVNDKDLPPGTAYNYSKPGFFDCPELSDGCKVSTLTIDGAGDTSHEKFHLPQGETTLYLADDTGQVYRARFNVPSLDDAEITVRVAKKSG
ncbi:MAG: hypothetical protein KC486_23385 [Myxococcales bacterium]|nr:hypothetical protein [Myxococcales bacterium]